MSHRYRSRDSSSELALEIVDELGRVIDRVHVRPVPEPVAPGDGGGHPSSQDTGPHRTV